MLTIYNSLKIYKLQTLNNNMIKNRLTTIFGIISLLGFAFQGIFGLAAAILICSMTGIILCILKKESKWLTIYLLTFTVDIACIGLFYFLLSNSSM